MALSLCGCVPNTVTKTQPAVIVGGSMGPRLPGQHAVATCHSCGASFVAGFLDDPANPLTMQALRDRKLICPNCGVASDNHGLQEVKANSAEIQLGRQPVRWSVVAFRKQLDGNRVYGVKRVVGLPGESIRFDRGNLLVASTSDSKTKDWTLLRKPLEVQRRIAIPVHDSKFGTQDRWPEVQAEPQVSMHDSLEAYSWKAFNPIASFFRSADVQTIEDGYACNPADSRQLHELDEVLVRLEFDQQPTVDLAFQINLRGRIFTLCFLWQENEVQFYDSSQQLPKKKWGIEWSDFSKDETSSDQANWILELSSIDWQVKAAINGHEIWSESVQPGEGAIQSSPVRIGWKPKKGRLAVKRIQISRDLYYLPAPLKSSPTGGVEDSILTAGDGCLVLGDNVPVSTDSRFWHPAAIPFEDILGTIAQETSQ